MSERATAVAHRLVDAVSTADPAALADCLAPDVLAQLLAPAGLRLRTGSDAVSRELCERLLYTVSTQRLAAGASAVGQRSHAWWRLRLAYGLPPDYLVEQHAYLDHGPDGRVERVRLLCSGYEPEWPAGG